jgi:hypothetical protein
MKTVAPYSESTTEALDRNIIINAPGRFEQKWQFLTPIWNKRNFQMGYLQFDHLIDLGVHLFKIQHYYCKV